MKNNKKIGLHGGGIAVKSYIHIRDVSNGELLAMEKGKNGEIYPQWQNIISVKDHRGELSHYVAVFADMSVIKRNQQEIDYLAHHDPLTKLPNRLLLNERLSTAIARSTASAEAL